MTEHEGASGPAPRDAIAALRLLTPTQHDAIVLALYWGQTYREVATTLRRPEDEVAAALRHGLARLRTLLLAPDPDTALA